MSDGVRYVSVKLIEAFADESAKFPGARDAIQNRLADQFGGSIVGIQDFTFEADTMRVSPPGHADTEDTEVYVTGVFHMNAMVHGSGSGGQGDDEMFVGVYRCRRTECFRKEQARETMPKVYARMVAEGIF
jgi:hypothetical protein